MKSTNEDEPLPSTDDVVRKFARNRSFDELTSAEYEILLAELSANSFAVPIESRKPEYTSLLMKYMFAETKLELGFYVQKFSGRFSSDANYIDSLENALRKPITIHALFDEDPNTQSQVFQLIENHIEKYKTGSMAIASSESKTVIKTLFKNDQLLHFVVSDKKRYRIETNPDSRSAYANFNDEFTGRNLSKALIEACRKGNSILAMANH